MTYAMTRINVFDTAFWLIMRIREFRYRPITNVYNYKKRREITQSWADFDFGDVRCMELDCNVVIVDAVIDLLLISVYYV